MNYDCIKTYTEDAVDEGVVAGVAHGQPVEDEEEDVDIFPPGQQTCSQQCFYQFITLLQDKESLIGPLHGKFSTEKNKSKKGLKKTGPDEK
jgi:hypothetical protein